MSQRIKNLQDVQDVQAWPDAQAVHPLNGAKALRPAWGAALVSALTAVLTAALIATLWLPVGTAAQTPHAPATGASAKAKKAKPRVQRPDPGQGESANARHRRLRLECKGRPNAGACEGHAS